MVVLVDAEDRENEGDLVIAAQMATPDAINFMAKYGRGLICLALTPARAEVLGLEMMVRNNGSRNRTAFTQSIEAREGISTGISAHDRARTISTAIDPTKGADDIVSPGHVFPLIARDGGVLIRAGHTEASVDLAKLAGLAPSAVICEIMNDDGTMARMPDLVEFAQRHRLKIGTIEDLIAYRLEKRPPRRTRRRNPLRQRLRRAVRTQGLCDDRRSRRASGDREGQHRPAPIPCSCACMPSTCRPIFSASAKPRTAKARLPSRCASSNAKAAASSCSSAIWAPRAYPTGSAAARAGSGASPANRRQVETGIGSQILRDLGVSDMVLLTNSPEQVYIGVEAFGLRIVETRAIE